MVAGVYRSCGRLRDVHFRPPSPSTVPRSDSALRLLRLLPAAALLVTASPRALCAATTRVVTWGDSITYGSHDFSNSQPPNHCWDGHPTNDPPENCGLALRLGSRLNNVTLFDPIWDIQLLNLGKGGETTAGALNRIGSAVNPCPVPPDPDPPLNSLKYWVCNGTLQANDLFVLMEGTNDVSKSLSTETAAFNLEQLGLRAEAFGLEVVIAKVIPRHPLVCRDPDSSTTKTLNSRIATVATGQSWPMVDGYCRLRRVGGMATNAFQDYTGWDCDDNGGTDRCGHPNSTGFDRLSCANAGCSSGAWTWTTDPDCPSLPPPFETVVATALPPRVILAAPPPPLDTGLTLTFSATLPDLAQTAQITWSFGDGTPPWATAPTASPATRGHVYYVPGPYTVSATVLHANGGTRTKTLAINVTGADHTIFRDGFQSGDASLWSAVAP
jgi:lysophospholipase L1-like esterase